MKVVAVIQARMASTRLKGKTLMKLSRHTLLDSVINSVKRNNFVDEIVVATSTNPEDDVIETHCKNKNIAVFRGDSENVLSRFIKVAKQLDPSDIIIRITADNPLNNPSATKLLFEKHLSEENDYTHVEGLSHIAYEFLTARSLLKLESCTNLDNSDEEHVTMYFRNNKELFKTASIQPDDLGLNSKLDKLLTIDSHGDFERFQQMKLQIDIDKAVDFIEIYNWLKTYCIDKY